jgi:hypothetical protein
MIAYLTIIEKYQMTLKIQKITYVINNDAKILPTSIIY